MTITLSLILFSYLLGSLSAAIIVCKLMGLPDPRTEGSHNPGATNVLRIGGKKAAALTLGGDMLKGLIPVALAQMLGADDMTLALAGIAAFLGHLYPVFFGFRGGKGVATALGVLLGTSWIVGLSALATWLFMAKVFRYSSLAALTAAVLAPFYMWLARPAPELIAMAMAMSTLLLWRHRGNIQRLISGQEDRIGEKNKA
ncbi:MAG: glycerol-3-phosphate 1-O-acyltransferase PlsY [Gammaproteobacteria bacterium]|nr:glycerol-3-phosphate 1-O-acyltransferase PlsY [Gammaproteobacteria bacterium]